ncbi:5-methylcytosine-specific restriction endonuclease system specificity protein McrC [Vibrio cholerae]|uniref:5-methylcytosine-specific restriction endonuclease system specificity protein McrC n=1 Tax=Vibrio cholerae TaxID=666 RepID=UPI0029EA67E5|nr:5-methylcytosine-specific restriction endonuclease system specificity protein McrC [Vibrio cholerae]EGR1055428.1 5-methylcytosine-specific restriction endonuclease system specificity protein McrC [Vibrio cholerae]HEQ3514761.1 5-methylcytosine-specific restriction endonuclease system specificity protein McrC [Vibrio cholerae]HEQ3577854.1 5-methylcytosine-specific restriction endonuclease system specificity protein McrC [Vibrio cholerae]
MSAVADVQTLITSSRRLGNIPVRNLWLLMLYASDLYRHLGANKVDVEDNPEEIADLVAEILCNQVEERMMRNLSYGYESKVAVLSRVRGRIDTLTTERQRLLEKGKVCCRFDELTVDTPRNRYVRSALERLSKLTIKTTLVHKCRALMLSLERLGVSKAKPINYSGKSERFGRHDISDQKMVAAADLAFSLALPTEFDGQFHLTAPDSQKEWLRKLFEKAIAGFYTVALDRKEWWVLAGKQFDWQISDKTSGIDEILPSMKTDIIIANRISSERLVIDTKFNSVTTKGWHREETLRSGYIYQMYTYLRSQEDSSDPKSLVSLGMLLHPTIGNEVTEMVKIQGHPIWFCTVNLGESAASIRERLLLLLRKSFQEKN